MKEAYFTPDKIKSTAENFRDGLDESLKRVKLTFRPQKSALLVLDLQSYFLDPGSHAYVPSAPAIIPGVQSLIQVYQSSSLPIFFTRHLNTPQNGGMMNTWWRELILLNNPLSAIVPEIDTSQGYVLQKTQYDAFYETQLEQLLRDRGVTQLVVSGVMTHLCCETTARSAFMRGFEVFFLIDGTATYSREFHQATLLNLSHGFASLATVKEILADLIGQR